VERILSTFYSEEGGTTSPQKVNEFVRD